MSAIQGVQGNKCEPYFYTVSAYLPQHNDEVCHYWKFYYQVAGDETAPVKVFCPV